MLTQSSTGHRKGAALTRDSASEIGLSALLHISQDTENIGVFMAQTGVEVDDLRAAAQRPEFLAAVLEFLCANEPLLLAFAANEGLAPQIVDSARMVLNGPEPERSI